MESIPREATFVRIIELTKNFKSQLGVNDKIFANLSVSLEFALDLF